MSIVTESYQKIMESLDTISWKRDWRWIAIYSFCIYAVILAFRLSFAGRWDHPELWVNGERILATHDAYLWLAKAKHGSGIWMWPLAYATQIFHKITGIGLGTIAFWAPAVVSSFVGVVGFLWGALLAGRNAGIIGGLIGSLTPGFFYRSRLGYFDTDMFTMLGPVLVAWFLAYLVQTMAPRGWFQRLDNATEVSTKNLGWIALGFGCVSRFMLGWHLDIGNVAIAFFWIAVGLVVVLGNRKDLCKNVIILSIFSIVALSDPYSEGTWNSIRQMLDGSLRNSAREIVILIMILSGGALAYLYSAYDKIKDRKGLVFGISGVLVALVVMDHWGYIIETSVGHKLIAYFNPSEIINAGGSGSKASISYPSILQSVIEAGLVSINEILTRAAYWPVFGWVSLVCCLIVVVLRPAFLLMLPLVALCIMSTKMGIRFSMFGGVGLMVGFGVVLYWSLEYILRRLKQRELVTGVISILFCVLILGVFHGEYKKIPITPVLPKAHAEALVELSELSPKNSLVWSWWDWGFSTQYFSGRSTLIDGGRHSGKDVFPVAYALSTDSLLQSNRMIDFAAERIVPGKVESETVVDFQWSGKDMDEVRKELASLKDEKRKRVNQLPQYVVVTWKDLTIAKWITHFGNWDVETGTTNEATINTYKPGRLGFNIERGAVRVRDGGGGLVRDITILNPDGIEKEEYYMNRLSPQLLPKAEHLVINSVSRQSVLMDRIGYNSTMRRLMTGDPNDPEIKKYFKLVVNKLPFARVYEVVQ